MNLTKPIAALLTFLFVVSAHAETIRFRVDLEVTKAFTGIPLGQTGTATVQYDDGLADQRTSENFHTYFGLYGYPETPPVTVLWDFGDGNAVYSEQGSITVTDAPFSYNADIYAVYAGSVEPKGITKGVFQNFTFKSGTALRLTDMEDGMIGGQALIAPHPDFIDLADFNTSEVAFFGNSAFVGLIATDITVLDVAADSSALFTAGSPVSLSQAIATPATQFDINYDVSFDSPAGQLQVFLNGVLLDTITPGATELTLPQNISVADQALLGLAAADLVFQYDGPTGSTMSLDNVSIPGSDLLNGDFSTQTLAAWASAGPGTVAVLVAAVPEPSGVLLVGCAVFGWASRGWRTGRGGLDR